MPLNSNSNPRLTLGFSRDLPKKGLNILEALNLNIFEGLGYNLFIKFVIPHCDFRTLRAIRCSSRLGRNIVNFAISSLQERIARFQNPPFLERLTINDLIFANTLHLPIQRVSRICSLENITWDEKASLEDLKQAFFLVLVARGTYPAQRKAINFFPHTVAFAPGLAGKAAQIESLEFHMKEGSDNAFEIPGFIGQFTGLKYFRLTHCRRIEVPNEFGQLGNLTELYLMENNLSELPSAILRLNHLYRLNLSKNKLEDLPAQMQTLGKLEVLDLDHNPLTLFPKGILTLPSLELLYMGNTYVSYYPGALCKDKTHFTLYVHDAWGNEDNLLKNARKVLNFLNLPIIVIPESWNLENYRISTDRIVVRDTLLGISEGIGIKGLIYATFPFLLGYAWWTKPKRSE